MINHKKLKLFFLIKLKLVKKKRTMSKKMRKLSTSERPLAKCGTWMEDYRNSSSQLFYLLIQRQGRTNIKIYGGRKAARFARRKLNIIKKNSARCARVN